MAATEPLSIITQIMAGITVLALLWLSARAFKKHFFWGAGVLLLSPLGAAFFGARYWKGEKLPLLAYLGTFATTAGLVVLLFGAWGGWELVAASRNAQQALKSQTLTPGDADAFQKASLSFAEKSGTGYHNKGLMTRIERELERAREREEIAARAEAMEEQQAEDEEYTLEDLYRRVPVKKERYRVNFRKIRVADAHKYVGSTIKLTRRNVGEKEYRLIGVKGGALQVMQKNGSGSFSFAFRKRDIEKLRVLIKEPY